MGALVDLIHVGDRVTITNRFGQRATGRAVMPCISGGWVLDMGGSYGTPGIANGANTVLVAPSHRKRRRPVVRCCAPNCRQWLPCDCACHEPELGEG